MIGGPNPPVAGQIIGPGKNVRAVGSAAGVVRYPFQEFHPSMRDSHREKIFSRGILREVQWAAASNQRSGTDTRQRNKLYA